MKITLLILLLSTSLVIAGTGDPPECLLEFVNDYKLEMTKGGGVRDIKRFEQFVGRLYPDMAQIKIDGLWYSVRRNAVMVRDWKVPSPTPTPK